MNTYNNKEVSQVILAPTAVQPTGATGDTRFVMICFTDTSAPVTVTIASLKSRQNALTASATASTAQATALAGVIALTTSL